MSPKRHLLYRYLDLPYLVQMRVAGDLGLLDESDRGLDEPTIFQRAYQRATERGVLEQFTASIDAARQSP